MKKFHIPVLCLFLILSLQTQSQTKKTKSRTSSFNQITNLNKIEALHINSKHCNIEIRNWNHDSIKIEGRIDVFSDLPQLSKDLINKIKIHTSNSYNTYFIKAEAPSKLRSTTPYNISLKIHIPLHLSVNIKNSNGSVITEIINGNSKFDLNYCDIHLGKLINTKDTIKNQLDLLFCKGNINHLSASTLKLRNCDIKIINCDQLDLNSQYTKLIIQKSKQQIKALSLIDFIQIASANKIDFYGNNTYLELDYLDYSAEIVSNKGYLKINNVGRSIQELSIKNNEAPMIIKTHPEVSYYINGEVNNGMFIHPNAKQLNVIKEGNKYSFGGQVGQPEDSKVSFSLFNKNANIEIH